MVYPNYILTVDQGVTNHWVKEGSPNRM